MNWQETLVTNKEINDYHKAIFPWMYQGNDEDWCEEQLHRLIALSETSDGKFLLEAQAKATWEAREPEIAEAERRGVRKVVEFCKQKIFNTFIDRDTGEPYLAFRDNADKEWQAFLKGIEGESRQELPK